MDAMIAALQNAGSEQAAAALGAMVSASRRLCVATLAGFSRNNHPPQLRLDACAPQAAWWHELLAHADVGLHLCLWSGIGAASRWRWPAAGPTPPHRGVRWLTLQQLRIGAPLEHVLAACPALERLVIRQCEVNPAALCAAAAPRLRVVELDEVNVSQEWSGRLVQWLAGACPALRELECTPSALSAVPSSLTRLALRTDEADETHWAHTRLLDAMSHLRRLELPQDEFAVRDVCQLAAHLPTLSQLCIHRLSVAARAQSSWPAQRPAGAARASPLRVELDELNVGDDHPLWSSAERAVDEDVRVLCAAQRDVRLAAAAGGQLTLTQPDRKLVALEALVPLLRCIDPASVRHLDVTWPLSTEGLRAMAPVLGSMRGCVMVSTYALPFMHHIVLSELLATVSACESVAVLRVPRTISIPVDLLMVLMNARLSRPVTVRFWPMAHGDADMVVGRCMPSAAAR